MATSLDEFAQRACDDLLRDGAAQAVLEAHTTERVVIFALANLPPGAERQRAFFTLGARFGNDPASGDAPLTDVYLRCEAWMRLLAPGEQLGAGSLAEDPQRVEILIVTHTQAQTGVVDGRLYLMRRDDTGRLIGLAERSLTFCST